MNTLDELATAIPDAALHAPDVSAWSVGSQVHHCLLASKGIADALRQAEPGARQPRLNLTRLLVMMTGWIPRGRGQAPRAALPAEQPNDELLESLLAEARAALTEAERVDPRAWWEHPIFGVMYRDLAIRFIHLHNRHHLVIIRDIKAATTPEP